MALRDKKFGNWIWYMSQLSAYLKTKSEGSWMKNKIYKLCFLQFKAHKYLNKCTAKAFYI